VLGLLFKDEIRTGARNLWLIASALIIFSVVIAAAEYYGRQTRHAEQLTWKDSIIVGLAQCLALVPGVSRSGATISAGLFLGLDRELSARFGFLLAIPAVAWFLRFLVSHRMYWFVGYRVALGTVVLILLGAGEVSAT
jgi:undecaprenyl-diphosphatase